MHRLKTNQPSAWKRFLKKAEVMTHPGIVCVMGITTAIVSGFLALHLTNPDEGPVITATEGHVRAIARAERIRNNPYLSPQMKAFALRDPALNRTGASQR